MKMNRNCRNWIVGTLVVLGAVSLSGCVVAPPRGAAYVESGPRGGSVWVEGHWGPGGYWHPGHWRER